MFSILLNSGGIDSNLSSYLIYCNNLFIKIENDCTNFIDKKYVFLNCIIKNTKIFSINYKNEYNCFFNYKNNYFKFYNLDYYCNKLIKINLLNFFFIKTKIITGHYFRKQKKYVFLSIDQKKDQCYFLTFKKKIYSNIGFFNKKIIFYISYKKKFICKNKKSTTGICFKLNKKKYFCNYYILENNYIYKNSFFIFFTNLGKLYETYFITKIKHNQIIISKYLYLSKMNILLIEKHFLYFKNCKIKINSQSIIKNVKIVLYKKKTFLLLYKNIFFIENQNCLLCYNELFITNVKIKKKN